MLVEPTRELVLTKVKELFPNDDPTEILALLNQYGVKPYERERDRVQLAILRLSKGDRDTLLTHIGYAKRDYRDILTWAEYQGKGTQQKYHAWLRGELEMDTE